MNVFGTSLLFGLAPEWIHISYTVQVLYLLPLRVRLPHTGDHLEQGYFQGYSLFTCCHPQFFQYYSKGWGYFLADVSSVSS